MNKKSFLAGAITVLSIVYASHLTYMNTDGTAHKITSKIDDILNGQYFQHVVDGNCKDEMGTNGFGWKINFADYFGCDRLQRALNGNFKAPNKNSASYK